MALCRWLQLCNNCEICTWGLMTSGRANKGGMESHADSVPQATHFDPEVVSEALVHLSLWSDGASRMRLWRVLLQAQLWAAMVPHSDEGPSQWATASVDSTWGPTCALFTSASRLLQVFPNHRPTLVRFRGIARVVAGAVSHRGVVLDPGHPGAFEVAPDDLAYLARGQIPPQLDDSIIDPPLGSLPEAPAVGLVRMVLPALQMVLPMVPQITRAWVYTSSATGPPDETCVAVHLPEVSDPAQVNDVLQQVVHLLVQTEELRCSLLLVPTNPQLLQQLQDGGGLLAYERSHTLP